jgi:triosephosphate isomerase (TIM)
MTNQRTPIIAGNWKMVKTGTEAEQFVAQLNTKLQGISLEGKLQALICPSFLSIAPLSATIAQLKVPVSVGAQTMESREEGAYTGEISPRMLTAIGVQWVIIGHSERRQYYNETDASVNAKVLAALKHHLTPIVCVGELLEQREQGHTDTVVKSQVTLALANVAPEEFSKLVFAYEPVWAIGTGKTCDAPEANRVCALIRETLASLSQKAVADTVRILYGGSVKPDNTAGLMSQSDIDGALVGGASLEADSFFNIIQATLTAKSSAPVATASCAI